MQTNFNRSFREQLTMNLDLQKKDQEINYNI